MDTVQCRLAVRKPAGMIDLFFLFLWRHVRTALSNVSPTLARHEHLLELQEGHHMTTWTKGVRMKSPWNIPNRDKFKFHHNIIISHNQRSFKKTLQNRQALYLQIANSESALCILFHDHPLMIFIKQGKAAVAPKLLLHAMWYISAKFPVYGK